MDELGARLDTLGWPKRLADETTWCSEQATAEGELPVYVRLGEHWLVATIVPFLHTRGDNSFELVRWLLRQNRDLYQAHFGIDEGGDVVLSVELPTESLDASEIDGALQNLVRYAIEQRGTLRRAAGG